MAEQKPGALTVLWIVAAALLALYVVLSVLARRPDKESAAPQTAPSGSSVYERCVKRALDKLLSFFGLVLLSPVFAFTALLIFADDPGPVLFRQKRVGKDRSLFALHKFRSMKQSAPHDVPTHLLEDPERYILRSGRFIRRSSLDELPQLWDIFRGKMSVIGPRPALWNQDDLIAEREKYGANGVLPGLTGWAQVNGRDELEIAEKARLDGVYVQALRCGGFAAMSMDARCFFKTILSVVRRDGVLEGEQDKGEKT
ncbi:MAG: sugar transferase [Clostridia bacterium]|nr:sugar transferase [Clostridia bacterium]